jgi:hypothetical protein
MMLATTGTPELVIFIAGILLYGALLWSIKRRFLKKLDRVFLKHSDDAPDFAEIRKRLDALNLDSAHFVFTMDRRANIVFRQNKITLVYGHIGSRSPGGIRGPVWTLRKMVYALADKNQMEWMTSNPDVFQCAMAGYSYSVFWVSLDRVLAG